MDRFKSMVSDIKSKAVSGKAKQLKMDMPGDVSMTESGLGYDQGIIQGYVSVAKQDLKISMDLVDELKNELETLSSNLLGNSVPGTQSPQSINSLLSDSPDISSNNINNSDNNNNNNNNNNNTDSNGNGISSNTGNNNNNNNNNTNRRQLEQVSNMQQVCFKLETLLQGYFNKKDEISVVMNSMGDTEFEGILDEIDSKTETTLNKDATSMEHARSDSIDSGEDAPPPLKSQLSELFGSFDNNNNNSILNTSNNNNNNNNNNGNNGNNDSMDVLFGSDNNINDNNNKNKGSFDLLGGGGDDSNVNSDNDEKLKGSARRQSTMDNFWNSIDSMATVVDDGTGTETSINKKRLTPKHQIKSKSLNARTTTTKNTTNTNANKTINKKANKKGFNNNKNKKNNNKNKEPTINLLTDSQKTRASRLAKERYDEIQKQFAIEDKEREDRQTAFDDNDARIKDWEFDSKGVRKNIRTLLTKLPSVLWENSGWKPITLANLVSDIHVKKQYRLACRLIHPDRSQQRGDSTERKAICERIFEGLNAAWDTERKK